ncbi:hypothetical protein FQZ97_982960 [compost metagenome]
MFANGLGEYVGGVVKGAVPVRARACQALAQAQLRVKGAGVEVAGQVQGRAFAAQLAKVGRVIRIALDAENFLAVVLDQHAAADATITTGRGGGTGHVRFSPTDRVQAHCSTAAFSASNTRPLSTFASCR